MPATLSEESFPPRKMTARSTPTVLDLFCGAGGMSLGCHQAGFHVLQGVDINEAALKTYAHNLHHEANCIDLSDSTTINRLPTASIVVGGPPCQGFSSAGLRKNSDIRNSLVTAFAQAIITTKPSAFLFENVEGFLTAEGGHFVFELLGPLIDAGYCVHLRKINAANFGVPQLRKRVVAIGGLGWNPSFPDFTHTAFGAPGAHLASSHLPLTSTVREVLHDLPTAKNTAPGFPQGHFSQPLQGLDLVRAELLKQGQTMKDLPEHLQHQSYQRRSMRRVQDGTATEKRGGPPSGIRRLIGDQPSKAITGGAKNEFLHYIENRGLTLRECARLQTFDDNFEFLGTLSEQAQLIGNAIPPRLAYVFAKSLASDFENQQVQTKSNTQGALLSFMPTLSDGYSPILRQLIDRVNSRFYFKRETMEFAL